MLVLKMVGYGDDVVRAYQLEDLHAHVWIGHHRYPTKGRVWHPGGAHPFVGMNEALVHNGDFANYAAMSEYLAQRHIYPLFLTDTEVSVLGVSVGIFSQCGLRDREGRRQARIALKQKPSPDHSTARWSTFAQS